MDLQESGEMYLEAIWVLSERHGTVRSIDVCDYMGYSKPSISRAMGLLKQGNYIEIDKDGYIDLNDSGREIARKIFERHTLLTDFLTRLGVDEPTAAEDACKIEHDISDRSFDAIKQLVEGQISWPF